MPRIPLYAKGAGPTVELATGQLGARPSVEAFTAPGRAVARAGEAIGRAGATLAEGEMRIQEGKLKAEKTRQTNEIEFQRRQKKIEFDFAMAERDAEDRRILSEEADRAVIATSNFLSENLDTDTRSFNKNFDAHSEELLSGLESKGYTDRRLQLVRNQVVNSIRGQRSSGANQAFNRGQNERKNAAESTIATLINQAAVYPPMHPERVRIENELTKVFEADELQGLGIKYTPAGVRSAISYADYNRRIEGAQTQTQLADILTEMSKDVGLTQGSREKLISDINRVESKLYEDAAEFALDTLNAAELSFDDGDKVEQAILQNGSTSVLMPDGSSRTLDFSQTRSQDVGAMLTALERNMRDAEDLTKNNILFSLSNGIDISAGVAANVANVDRLYTPEGIAVHGKTPDQLDDISLAFARSNQDVVTNAITAGEINPENFAEMRARLDIAESVLESQLGGRTPLALRDPTSGDGASAATTMSGIAKAREDLNKAVVEQNHMAVGAQTFRDGDFQYVADVYKPEDTKKIVDAEMARITQSELQSGGNPIPRQVDLLSQNNQKFERFVSIMDAGARRATNPNLDVDGEEFTDVQAGIELYREIKLGGEGVLNMHTDQQTRTVYESILTLEPVFGLRGAVRTIQQRRDIEDVNASYKTVEQAVENIVEEGTGGRPWYSFVPGLGPDEEFTVQDTSSITSYVKKLTKEYIALGVSPDKAVELAATDYGKSHRRVRNIMVPITDDLPDNIEEMATLAVQDAMLKFPVISESGYESEDLSIGNIDGTVDRWTLLSGGGYPVQKSDGRLIQYSLDDLNGFVDTVRSDERLADLAKKTSIARRNQLDLDYKMRRGPFEGMTRYEAQGMYLRLTQPWRSYRLEPEDIQRLGEKRIEMLEATPEEVLAKEREMAGGS